MTEGRAVDLDQKAKVLVEKLSLKQQKLLLSDGRCAASYPPAKKLLAVGIAQSHERRFGQPRLIWSDLGIIARAKLQNNDPAKYETPNDKT